MVNQAHQAFYRHLRVSPSPAGQVGSRPLNFLNLIMGAAYSSLGQTKVLYATSFAL